MFIHQVQPANGKPERFVLSFPAISVRRIWEREKAAIPGCWVGPPDITNDVLLYKRNENGLWLKNIQLMIEWDCELIVPVPMHLRKNQFINWEMTEC